MSSDTAIRVTAVSKLFHIYEAPQQRLYQTLLRFVARLPIGAQWRARCNAKASAYARIFPALSNIELDIPLGRSVGIVGRNGSGKSTLLQIICGTLAPTQGSVETYGRVAALLELGSGFNPEYTGRENVYLNAQLLGLRREQVTARFDEIEKFADIGDFINEPVKTYSSGMFVRLAFAVIAHVDADILIIDEALAVGDAFFTQKCMRFLREFMQRGTLLFVSHDTAAVKSLCDEVIWLDHGRVAERGPPKDVCNHYLEAFYEQLQGATKAEPAPVSNAETLLRAAEEVAGVDARSQYLNRTNLRNDLEIFAFDAASAGFGLGGATIVKAELLDKDDQRLSWAVGGELCTLKVLVECRNDIKSPIVGFQLKDRLGQVLIGENTYLNYLEAQLEVPAGQQIEVRFAFSMPIFPKGDYSIDIAVASGSQSEHVQHQWLHDAILFRSESSSVSTGLIGVPIAVSLEVQAAATAH